MSEEQNVPERWSSATLNYRALQALRGELVTYEGFGATAVADALIELLRSTNNIEPEVRALLADALDRGRSSYRPPNDAYEHVIRLMVEDLGPKSTLHTAAHKRLKYLEAMEEYLALKEAGMKSSDAKKQAFYRRDLHGDSMRKSVKPFYDAFRAAFDNRGHELHGVSAAIVDDLANGGLKRATIEDQEEAYYYIFSTQYVWASAASDTGFPDVFR